MPGRAGGRAVAHAEVCKDDDDYDDDVDREVNFPLAMNLAIIFSSGLTPIIYLIGRCRNQHIVHSVLKGILNLPF